MIDRQILEDAVSFIESLSVRPLLTSDDIEMTLDDVQRHAEIEAASLRKRAMLAARPAITAGTDAGAAKVKPLEWHRPPMSDTLQRAETAIGTYRSWTHCEANGQWFWELSSLSGGKVLDSVGSSEAEVQAAAQADYEGRILSALTPEPAEAVPVAAEPSPAAKSGEAEAVERLKDAVEGECEGLALSDEQAIAILSHVALATPSPQPADAVREDVVDKFYERAKSHWPEAALWVHDMSVTLLGVAPMLPADRAALRASTAGSPTE